MKLSNNLKRYIERMKAQGEKCENITAEDVRCYKIAKKLGLISDEWVGTFHFKLKKELL